MANKISQIMVDLTTYDIDAKTLGGLTYAEIVNQINAGAFIKSTDAANTPKGVSWTSESTTITGTLEASDPSTKGHIYLVPHNHNGKDTHDEYVVVGTDALATWEKLGNTDIDLSNYAQKGTYTSSAASAANSGAAGAGTYTTSNAGAVTATGTVTVTYSKAAEVTGSANGSTASNTGMTKPSATGSFTGEEATLAHEVTVAAHSHTVNVSKATVYSADTITASAGTHSHTVDTHQHDSVSAIQYVGLQTTSGTVTSTPVLTNASSFTAQSSALVQVEGNILKILPSNVVTFASFTKATTSAVTSVTHQSYNLTTTAISVAGTAVSTVTTTSDAGDHTHAISRTSTSVVTGATLSNASVSVTVADHTYTPAGSVTVAVASHSHTYNAPAAHTHSIALSTATATGTAAVAVGNHTHSVTIKNHTHTIAHTHTTTI